MSGAGSVLVTGGTGTLGPDVGPAARAVADLATGEGLERALQGAGTVLHHHLVYLSIVGCDANPYPYYRATQFHEFVPLPGFVGVPTVGGALKAFAAGTNLAGPDADRGARTYDAWLREQAATG
jgi:hypothetical protein